MLGLRGILVALMFVLFASSVHADDKPTTPTASYYVSPQQFNGQIQITDQGFTTLFALFQNATASFNFNEGNSTISRLRIALDTTSLTASNPATTRDVMALLNEGAISEIAITSPDAASFSDGKASLKGTLSLHGITKPVTIDASLNRTGKNLRSGVLWSGSEDTVGVSLKTNIKRADFGIGTPPAPEKPSAEATQERFGDTINLLLELQAIRQ
jgi:hypothetical protein